MHTRKNIAVARKLRRGMTDAERALWRILRNQQLGGCKFRRQHSIGKYVVDFICLDANLVIEIDGGQHAEQMAEDAERTRFLHSRGFQVVRFWNNEVLANLDAVAEAILTTLSSPEEQAPRPSAVKRLG